MSRKNFISLFVTLMMLMPTGILIQTDSAKASSIPFSALTTERPVFGWVNDSMSGLPVQTTIYFADQDGRGATNFTTSNVLGFYSLNLTLTNNHRFLMMGLNNQYLLNQTEVMLDESVSFFHLDMELDPAPPRDSIVSGYLLDAVTGLPLANESMTAASLDYLNTTSTNASGYYSMNFIPGDYTMGASSDGYESTTIRFTLGANWSIWRNISLEPVNCVLKGYVRNAGGPLENAYVYVEEPWNVNPYANDYENYTNAAGFYSFNITRGTKSVGFSHDGQLSAARTKTLHAGVNWLNVTLANEPADQCTIRGYVRDFTTSSPIDNASIRVGNANNSWTNGTSADINGYYNIRTVPGSLRMEAAYWEWDEQYISNGTELTVLAGQTIWQNFTLTNYSEPHAMLRGNVTLDGVPVSGARINMQAYQNSYGVSTDPSGYYEMDLAPGYSAVSASYNWNGEESNVERLAVSLDSGTDYWHDFNLQRLDFDSIILGTIKNQGGQIIKDAICFFTNDETGSATFQSAAISDFNGTYEIGYPSTEEAIYTILAEGYKIMSGQTSAVQEWNWMNMSLQSLGSMVTVKGYLTDLDGNPIVDHELMVSGTDWMNWTSSNATGYYQVKVPKGDVYISSQLEGFYDPGRLFLNTRSGSMFWLNVSARPKPLTQELRGSVRETDTTPVPGATVIATCNDRMFAAVTGADGNFTIMAPQGQFYITYRTDGYGSGQYTHVRLDSYDQSLYWSNLTLDRQGAWIEGPVSDYVDDVDGDGKYDWLYVNATVNATSSGRFTVEGDLYPSQWSVMSSGMSSTQAAAASVDVQLSVGLNNVQLAFSGVQIEQSGTWGYTMELDLYDDSWNLLDRRIEPLSQHDWSEFDSPDIRSGTPAHTFGPVDTDFDGLYNLLLFNATVEVLAQGNYTMMSRLYNVPSGQNSGDMAEIDGEMQILTLSPGTHTIEFAFAGTAIYGSGWHLGLASVMMFNSSMGMDQSSIISQSQAYVPYDYKLFQHYPVDSKVYGWVNDSMNAPIDNLRVEIYNVSNRYLNFTHTDSQGYYELGGWGGTWLLALNDDEQTARPYQGNLTTIILPASSQVKKNRIIQDEVLDANVLSIAFGPDDWNKTIVDTRMNIYNDNQTIRYEFDLYEFGNGDGFISESEVDMLMVFLGSQIAMPANLTDHMAVDNITYDLSAGSVIYDIGIVGKVTDKDPVYIHQRANYTASIPVSTSHDLRLNLSYDNTYQDSMSESNSTFISHVIPPSGWGRTGNCATPNVSFSGSDYITADPGLDPDTGDAFEYEWVNITISDSQVPTMGAISGNVTLDGRTTHFGVTVRIINAASGIEVTATSTDIYGFYSVNGILPGTYNITAEKPGYAPETVNGIAVIAGVTSWAPDMVLYSYPPTIANVHFVSPVNNETAITVFADVTDDGQVGPVTLMYTNVSGQAKALAMSRIGGSTYSATIPAQVITGTVTFYIIANDTIGNSARFPDPGVLTVTVVEKYPPSLSNLVVTSNPTEYGDPTNITITVEDASAITGVWLYNQTTGTNVSMASAGAGVYYAEGTCLVPGLYQFTIWATDSYGNVNHIDGSFTVQDSTGPAISDIAISPANPEFGSPVNISANITDLAGLSNAWLRVIYPNGTVMDNYTMVHGALDSYHYNFSCPVTGQYYFEVGAVDQNGVPSTSAGNFWLNDTVLPTIKNLTFPASIEFGDQINITADIEDLGGLSNVSIQMFGPAGSEIFNDTMNKGSYWYLFIPDSPGQYNFTIWVVDGNNMTNSSSSTFSVVDTTPPTFISVNVIPQVQEVHGSVNVRAVLDDLDTIPYCYLNLTSPDGAWLSNTSMSFTGNVFSLNRTYSLLGDYTFTLWARDASGNWNHFDGSITTEDTQEPVANAGIDRTVPAGTTIALNASASTDNYGIANYTWTLTDNGVQTLYGKAAEYTFTVPGTYDIELLVTDYAGLTSTDIKVITVTDVATTGMVTGTVLNGEGAPISGVTVYVKDSVPRIESITDNTGSFILENVPAGERTIVFVHPDYQRKEVAVTVSAGMTATTGDVTLELTNPDNPCGVLLIILLIVGSLVLYYLYKRRKAKQKAGETVIDEIFFMSTDGRLIKHFTRRLKPDMDQDILSGMLVAVQDFIKDSFRGEEGGLEELKFGKFQIVLGRGKYTIIAALILGDDTKPFKPQIERCLKDIEANHQEALETWDGQVDRLTPTFRYINDLISGKYS